MRFMNRRSLSFGISVLFAIAIIFILAPRDARLESASLKNAEKQERQSEGHPSAQESMAQSFRDRARQVTRASPVSHWSNATEENLPEMRRRLDELTRGKHQTFYNLVSNLTVADRVGWLKKFEGMTDSEIRAAQRKDIESSSAFRSPEAEQLRNLISESGGISADNDCLLRWAMEIQGNWDALAPGDIIGHYDPQRDNEAAKPYLERTRLSHEEFQEGLRSCYVELLKVELTGFVADPDNFVQKVLAASRGPRAPLFPE